MIVSKTLLATTQLCTEAVEMENRESPRQHRKQRLLPLHPRRLEGQTDSDTFFASIKSIRNFACVQLFFHLTSQFLFVRCMRREAHSHGAYQDFVREVGAPNVLLTDNAQTQVGAKWTKTSRENITRQIATAPYNQNQNQAERKIKDVKNRVLLVLRHSKAPAVFWCYCLRWVVDCMNHSAVTSLDWRTPIEVLDGHKPDISVFRFAFFQPVWYYEPAARYPDPNFCPGRFVGIAWDHGDAFTYRIWTCPPGKPLTEGTELIRNIVKPQQPDMNELTPSISAKWDLEARLSSQKKRKRRKPEAIPPLTSIVPTRVYFSTAAPSDSGDSEEQGGVSRFARPDTNQALRLLRWMTTAMNVTPPTTTNPWIWTKYLHMFQAQKWLKKLMQNSNRIVSKR